MQTDLIGHRLKLQHLKIVMAVAEWGSMQRAAKQLAISQPVVSKAIAELENALRMTASLQFEVILRVEED